MGGSRAGGRRGIGTRDGSRTGTRIVSDPALRPALDETLARGARSGTFSGRRVELRIDSLMTVRDVTNHPDQPWKIARMNKFTYALALGAGLVLSLAAPTAHANPVVQALTPSSLTAAEFKQDFTATTGVLSNNYTFMNTPQTGVVESQVFQGTGIYSGLTAYAYQFGVNNVSDSTGTPTSVNSASLQFGATPVPVSLNSGGNSSVYVVTDGQVGNINVPQAAPGSTVQVPTSIAWQPGTTTGSLTFQYLDATANTGPLQAGATSGTIVVITNVKSTTMPFVSIQNANPQVTGYPQAYAPTGERDRSGPRPRAGHHPRLDRRPRRPGPGPPRPSPAQGRLNPDDPIANGRLDGASPRTSKYEAPFRREPRRRGASSFPFTSLRPAADEPARDDTAPPSSRCSVSALRRRGHDPAAGSPCAPPTRPRPAQQPARNGCRRARH